MIEFGTPSMFAAARAHVSSLRWRLAIGALFALGASLVLGSASIGLSWFLAFWLATGFDAMLGRAYLEARGIRDRARTGVMFVWGCAFSVLVVMGMTLGVAIAGGGAGKVLAVCMAASALVSVMLFLFQAPGFMLITAAPAALCLFLIPLMPEFAFDAPRHAALGAACGAWGLLAYVARAARYNAETLDELRAASREAGARQAEAEARRAEAEEANSVKSKFLAAMTHELRTPLNAVIGYAEILQEDLDEDGRDQSALDARRIVGSAKHLLRLIDQILNMTSLDAGHEGVSARAVDVQNLLEAALQAVEEEARAAGNRVSMRVDPAAARAVIDADKLAACVGALLSNAVKFTRGGLIAVTAASEQAAARDWLVIIVSDTGCGISRRDLDNLFTPFERQAASPGTGSRGMGLGLAIAQRMARALGGDIGVESQLGRGSTFTIRVPLRAADAGAAVAAA